MHRLTLGVISALVACVTSSAADVKPQVVARSPVNSICPRGGKWVDDVEEELIKHLSDSAKVYLPGSSEFEAASTQWSQLETPNVNVVVVPGTPDDVAQTVNSPPPLSLSWSGR